MTSSVTASLIFANTCLSRELFYVPQISLRDSKSKHATTVTPSGGGGGSIIFQYLNCTVYLNFLCEQKLKMTTEKVTVMMPAVIN